MSEVLLPVGSTGESLRTIDRAERGLDEVVVLSDATNPDLQTKITTAAPADDDPGVVVRHAGDTGVTLAFIDEGNSTSTPLAGGAVFTGTAIDVSGYNGVVLHVDTSHASASGGLEFQTSTDGTNWSHSHGYTMPASSSRHFEETLPSKWFRIKYTNGSTLQTHFRLQAKLLKTAPVPHVHSIEHTITGNHPATIGRVVIVGKVATGASAGNYVNATVTAQGRLAAEVEGQIIGDPVPTTALLAGVEDGAGNVATLLQPLTDTELRATPVDTTERAQTLTMPDVSVVGATSAEIVAAAAGTGKREITIHLPTTVTTGIHINVGAAATTSKFLLQPGNFITLNTRQQIQAIRAGIADVNAYIIIAV